MTLCLNVKMQYCFLFQFWLHEVFLVQPNMTIYGTFKSVVFSVDLLSVIYVNAGINASLLILVSLLLSYLWTEAATIQVDESLFCDNNAYCSVRKSTANCRSTFHCMVVGMHNYMYIYVIVIVHQPFCIICWCCVRPTDVLACKLISFAGSSYWFFPVEWYGCELCC